VATLLSWIFVWKTLGKSDWKPFAGAVAIYVLAFLGSPTACFPTW
jgi:hypothetical protein